MTLWFFAAQIARWCKVRYLRYGEKESFMQQLNREDRRFLCRVLWVVDVLLFLPKKSFQESLKTAIIPVWHSEVVSHSHSNEWTVQQCGWSRQKASLWKEIDEHYSNEVFRGQHIPLIVYINILFMYIIYRISYLIHQISYIIYHISYINIIYQPLKIVVRLLLLKWTGCFYCCPIDMTHPNPPVLLSGLVESACWAWWIWWNCVGWVSEHLPGQERLIPRRGCICGTGAVFWGWWFGLGPRCHRSWYIYI